MNFSKTELAKFPLLYKDGVVHFAGRTFNDRSLQELRRDWVNELGKFLDEWLIVFDEHIIIGDQTRKHDSVFRASMTKEMSGVEFLGKSYNNVEELKDVPISVYVDGVHWNDSTIESLIKGKIKLQLEELLAN
jgi:hypothetical protein